MSEIILRSSLPVPSPKEPINIRPATMDDLDFIDSLQKKYSKNLAFLPYKALEGKINAQQVLIAEEVGSCQLVVDSQGNERPTTNYKLPTKLGYLIGQDQYFKRDEVGIIYHLAVEETKQRGFIGASLLKAQFDRSAYGCKLYCCWCAQDLEANYFYESMGFVPIAFRAGSEKKQRVHLFWQKRIRENDQSTPWWYPSETKGGMMMEDRLAFPIPPGKHWTDEMPIILPRDTHRNQPRKIEDASPNRLKKKEEIKPEPEQRKVLKGLSFAAPKIVTIEKDKPKQPKKQKMKNDPKFASAARELRDRYLEKVNQEPLMLENPGKYHLVKQLEAETAPKPLLLAA